MSVEMVVVDLRGLGMFTHTGEVVRALQRYRDCYDPRTTSLMTFGGGSDPHAEPFRSGFIVNLEERAELVRRLEALEERERMLLVFWHVEGRPVTQIANALDWSRVHCYRVQRRALEKMLDPEYADAGTEDMCDSRRREALTGNTSGPYSLTCRTSRTA